MKTHNNEVSRAGLIRGGGGGGGTPKKNWVRVCGPLPKTLKARMEGGVHE